MNRMNILHIILIALVINIESYYVVNNSNKYSNKFNKLNMIHNEIITNNDMLLSLNNIDISSIVNKASKKALDGGVAGASAAAIQVVSLMWLRTTLNYQYRYGTSTSETLKTLYKDGGIPRFYQGLPFAIVQGPLSRFGDTASNALMASIVESLDPTGAICPLPVRTALGSAAAGIWRIILMPVDTAKTCMQVNGKEGLSSLYNDVSEKGPAILYYGAIAASAATFVGHFPWFYTYNYLSSHLPTPDQLIIQLQSVPTTDSAAFNPFITNTEVTLVELLEKVDPRILTIFRSAFIGLCASSVSDIASNSLRVLKTSKQTFGQSVSNNDNDKEASYLEIAKNIIATEGIGGLFGRGLQTRLLSNALQGMLFSILFKYFQQNKQ